MRRRHGAVILIADAVTELAPPRRRTATIQKDDLTQRISPPTSVRRARIPPGGWGLFLLVPAVYFFLSGVKAWMAAAQNKAPTVVSYVEFTRRVPTAGWYTITGCVVDLTHSVYWTENNVCIDVYAPLLPGNGRSRDGSDIYVEIDDPSTITAVQDSSEARKRGGPSEANLPAAAPQRRDVSGLVSFGSRDPVGDWSKAGVNAATTTFIYDGWKPNPTYGYVATLAGLAFAVVSVRLLAKGFAGGPR